MDLFTLGAGDDGHLRAVHHGFVFTQGPPGFISRDGGEVVVVAGGFAATLFFHGLGLFASVGDGGEQPFPVQALAVVVLQFHFGAGGEVRAVTFALGHGGVVSQGVQSGLGEGLATGVGFVAAGVVVVLVIFTVTYLTCTVLVHQGVGGVLEGVVLHGHGGSFDALFVGEAEYTGLFAAAAGLGVAEYQVQFGGVAMVVGDDQGRLFFAVHTAVLVTVMPAFFGGQAVDELQVAFPVLDAVFPFFRRAFEVKDRVDDAPLFQQGAHDGVGGLGLEDAAVVHQAQAPGRGLDDHFIGGAAVAGVAPDEFVDHACETPYWLAILPHHQIHWLFQYIRRLHVRIGTGQMHSTLKQLGKAFGQREADDNEVI